jgi:hypothetical protein
MKYVKPDQRGGDSPATRALLESSIHGSDTLGPGQIARDDKTFA